MLRVLVVAPAHGIGGQAQAARDIVAGFAGSPEVQARLQAIDPMLPGPFRVLTTTKYLRSFVRSVLYLVQLLVRVPSAEVVHVFAAAHTAFLFGAMPALLIARLYRRPAILNYHDGRAADHLARSPRLLRWAVRQARIVVVPSGFLHDLFAREGIATVVVPNTVDPERFLFHVREPLPCRLLSVRLLEPLYAVENTLEAARLLQATWPELAVEIYGDGVSAEFLKARARQLGLERTTFHGAIAPERMPDALAQGGVMVNSSRADNTPLFILESFAAGLPVVSTAAGGIPYLIEHGRTGLLVAPGDPAGLADAVATVFRDPALAGRLVREAQRELPKFTWATAREKWLEVYAQATRRPKG